MFLLSACPTGILRVGVQLRERSGVTKREMKSARYLYVVYPGFSCSFFDG